MMREKGEPGQISPITPVLLLAASLALALLALFQWMELVLVRSGGQSVCSINQTVNCEVVWNSEFASRLQHLFGIPVAGMGMIWGITAFAVTCLLVYRIASGGPVRVPTAAIRIVAGTGLMICIVLVMVSFRAKALCLTCLATVAIVIAFGLTAWRLLPGSLAFKKSELRPALGWSVGFAFASYLLLLAPGLATPRSDSGLVKMEQVTPRSPDNATETMRAYLAGLPKSEQQAVSDSLAIYRHSPAPELGRFEIRRRLGPADAPVRFVEFTDVLCGHCAQLLEVMKQIEQVVPSDKISVEARNFPLDAACNPAIRSTDGSNVRCLGAKAQICLEKAPDFWELRGKLFAEQHSLTPQRTVEIASSGSLRRSDLEACLASPETTRKLNEDIAYAMLFSPQGTPLVLINGREGTSIASFLLAMAMTGANLDSPAFAALPPSRSPDQQ